MEMLSHEEALARMEETIRGVFNDPHLFQRPRGDVTGGFTWVMYEDISAIGTVAQACGYVRGVARLDDLKEWAADPTMFNEETLCQSIFSVPDTNGMAEALEGTDYSHRTNELVAALMDKEFAHGMTLRDAARGLTNSLREIVAEATPEGEEYQQYVEVFGE